MKIAVRVDASVDIATGHVVRCMTLAGALKARGADVLFICRDHRGNQAARIESAGFPVIMLPAPPPRTVAENDYAAWLGVTQDEDAEQTVSALSVGAVDWLVVDHYGLDERWERAVGPHAGNVLVIDDLANRAHACEVLLDQNHGADADGRYDRLVPATCRLLLGPRYALLNGAYARQAPRVRRKVERILLYFGGVDSDNATGLALEALTAPALSTIAVDAVIGAQNPHREAILATAARRGNTNVHGGLPHLADLMAKADLAVGAAGTTTWERLCCGLPSVVVSVAANQRPGAEALAADGLIDYAGPLRGATAEKLRAGILRLVGDPPRLERLSRAGPLIVDGLGAERLAETILPSAAEELRLRPASSSDVALLFGWANDPDVRRQSLNSAPIGWSGHVAWFNERIGSDRCHIFVLETPAGLPVGQIRFDLRDRDRVRLSYLLDPVARGRHWATRLVRLGIEELQRRGDFHIDAEVRTGNTASRKVFERLGFGTPVAKDGLCLYTAATSDFGRTP